MFYIFLVGNIKYEVRKLLTTQNVKYVIIAIIIILCGVFAAVKINHYINVKNEPQPTIMTQEDSQNPLKLKEEVNHNSGAHLNTTQAREVTNTITKIIERDRKPDTVVQSTGQTYLQDSKQYAKDKKTDAFVITPAKGEKKEVKDIKPTDTVQLNQYNIQAYPKNQMGLAYYNDKTIEVDYQKQIKVFGKHMYVGPVVKVDKDGKTGVGVKMTIPF